MVPSNTQHLRLYAEGVAMNFKSSMVVVKKRDIWKKLMILPSATILEAINNLNREAIKIVLVCDSDGRLMGTVCDGDIRRSLIKNVDLCNTVETIMCKNPLTVPLDKKQSQVMSLMSSYRIRQVPITDESGKVIGLHIWEDSNEVSGRANKFVIMAGGRGRRMLPATNTLPKPMLEIAGKPMLEHILERAKLDGFSDFVITVHHLGEIIKDYFGDGTNFGVNIEYISEELPLGTAGALSLLQPDLSEAVIVTNGDVLTNLSYINLLLHHIDNESFATMAVRAFEWENPFGVVSLDGIEIVGFEEKPVSRTLVNSGIYALNPQVISFIQPATYCDMPTLFEEIRKRGHKTIVYPIHEKWMDVGNPEDLSKATKSFSQN
jgi:dTDP-glucose pyrophosphorylase/CBS domain-containing protein